ncbi:hypothetical protein [Streptomyces sp. NPDC086787]
MLYDAHTQELMIERRREAERERVLRAVLLQRRAERITRRARRALSAIAV